MRGAVSVRKFVLHFFDTFSATARNALSQRRSTCSPGSQALMQLRRQRCAWGSESLPVFPPAGVRVCVLSTASDQHAAGWLSPLHQLATNRPQSITGVLFCTPPLRTLPRTRDGLCPSRACPSQQPLPACCTRRAAVPGDAPQAEQMRMRVNLFPCQHRTTPVCSQPPSG